MEHAGLACVILLYGAVAVLIVPTTTQVAISDDWVYTRAVETLLSTGRLEILDVAAANALVQVFWALPFVAVFDGPFGTLGAVRLASVVFTCCAAIAFYALCREIGLRRGLAALGSSAYLFQPLTLVLGFSFLSDPYFNGMLILTTWAAARGLRNGTVDGRWMVLASTLAALTYLQRQPAVLIPLAVAAVLVLTGRLRPDRRGAVLLVQVSAIPLLTFVVHSAWFATGEGASEDFLAAVTATGLSATATILGRMAFFEIVYAGLFVLPIGLGAAFALPRLATVLPQWGWLLVGAWTSVIVGGLSLHARAGQMPFIGPYVNPEGVGPSEIVGARPPILQPGARGWLTLACAISAILLIMLAVEGWRHTSHRLQISCTLGIGIGQGLGAVLPSFLFWQLGIGLTLDRYLSPLVPFALCFALLGLQRLGLRTVPIWVLVGTLGCYGTAASRDYLVWTEAVWELAEETIAEGVDITHLDGGYPWVGYYLHERSLAEEVPRRQVGPEVFWTAVISPVVDPRFLISSVPVEGYTILREKPYSAWLDPRPTRLLLVRRDDVGPLPDHYAGGFARTVSAVPPPAIRSAVTCRLDHYCPSCVPCTSTKVASRICTSACALQWGRSTRP